jgi:hypothetical protein
VLLKPLGHLSDVLKQFSRNIGNAHIVTDALQEETTSCLEKKKGALERALMANEYLQVTGCGCRTD